MCPAGQAYSATLSLLRQDVTEILPKCQQWEDRETFQSHHRREHKTRTNLQSQCMSESQLLAVRIVNMQSKPRSECRHTI